MHIPYLTEFLIVAVAHLLAVMSPGPDFVLVSKNSLLHSRRAGVFTSIGLGLGILVHVFYSLLGIGLLISKSIVLFSFIKYAGALYLIYIGYKTLRSARKGSMQTELASSAQLPDMKPATALWNGFMTNVTNPKATLFFLALFTQVVKPGTPIGVQLIYGAEMSVATMLWFSGISCIFSHARLKNLLSNAFHHVERAFGVVMIALGLKVAFSSNR